VAGNNSTVVGIDEAGYGPRLGPLVVAVAAFRLSGPPRPLRELLPLTAERRGPVRVDDSKKVYRGGAGLGALERSVLAFRAVAGRGAVPDLRPDAPPFELCGPPTSTLAAAEEEVGEAAASLRAALAAARVEVLEVRSRTVGVRELNRGVEAWGSKARVLFEATMELARPYLLAPGATAIRIDRHGGRKCYSPLLTEALPGHHHWIVREEPKVSTYRFPREVGEAEVSFEVGGDGLHLSTALASMCAKYVRELNMRAFNRHFGEADPTLRPTAGYALDARRWLAESRAARVRLGVAEADLVRAR
jgi:ribonuclease HII